RRRESASRFSALSSTNNTLGIVVVSPPAPHGRENSLGEDSPWPLTDVVRRQVADLAEQVLAAGVLLQEDLLHGAVEAPAVLRGDGLGGDHDDRDRAVRLLLAQLLEELEAVQLRHEQVEQDQVGSASRGRLEGRAPVPGLGDVPALLLEGLAE